MKTKQLIRFYFSADNLNRALDNLIKTVAVKSPFSDGGRCAEKILKIIQSKSELQKLWAYLDGIISLFPENERAALRLYGFLKVGLKKIKGEYAREIKRVTIKFTRRLKFGTRFETALRLVGEYYCLL